MVNFFLFLSSVQFCVMEHSILLIRLIILGNTKMLLINYFITFLSKLLSSHGQFGIME